MTAGGAAADAVLRARRLPHLKVGLHLVLVEGATVLPRRRIPDLLDASGLLPSAQVRLGFRYFLHPSIREQLAAEIRAQFEAFSSFGLALDHVNAHKHMHLHPTVGRMTVLIGKDYGLRAMRVPTEPLLTGVAAELKPTVGSYMLNRWSSILRRQALNAGLAVNDHVFGIALSGHMTAERVIPILHKLPPGLTEMYFHPASGSDQVLERLMPNYEHQAELECLLNMSFREAIVRSGLRMTTWTE